MKVFGPDIVLLFVLVVLISACDTARKPVPGSDLAVLAQQAEGYRQARSGQPLVFPRDHGAHPDYRIEWWYLTANLSDSSGNPYGAQWTLFRLALQPADAQHAGNPWQSNQVFMAHIAITTADRHVSFQRYSRGSEQQDLARAGVTAKPFAAWLDDWSLHSTGNEWLPLEVRARQGNQGLRLDLQTPAPLILQGEAGFSQKHANGGGSFYYSQPFLAADGELLVDGETIAVSGEAWLDREWSSQFLQRGQTGWDWFSLHLENGEKLMLFQLRQNAGIDTDGSFIHAALMRDDGSKITLDSRKISLKVLKETVVAGRKLPLNWRIELPQIGRNLEIKALHTQQWMDVDFPYWEGAISVHGEGSANRGRGYMELTGYQ